MCTILFTFSKGSPFSFDVNTNKSKYPCNSFLLNPGWDFKNNYKK